ncbi:sensor histidine kinase [Streptomyces sp. NPDC003996]
MIRRLLGGNLRLQLTAFFGLMFFLAATAVLAVALILVHHSMQFSLEQHYPAVVAQGTDRVQVHGYVVIDGASRQIILDSMDDNLMVKGGLTVLTVGVVATTLGWLVAGRLLRPLNRITSTTERIAGRTLHRRIDLDEPPGEVKRLADSFDSMLDRLDAAFAGQDRFIANAAHELKTPLAVGRTLVEVAMARPDAPPEIARLGENLLAVNGRHERLIDSLLTLARAESATTDRAPVDLADIARTVVSRIHHQAQEEGLDLDTDLPAAPATGDPVLLEQLVQNLVENAIKYNTPGGWVRVRTETTAEGSRITVSNTGVVVAPHEVPMLFEPFRRLTDRVGSARGSGLGLSIVRAVARVHDGDADARARPQGGLDVHATLPTRHAAGRNRTGHREQRARSQHSGGIGPY